MASPSDNTSGETNWWDNTASPLAPLMSQVTLPAGLGSRSAPVQNVPSHVSIASSHTLSSVGTLPVVRQGQIGYEPKPAQAGGPSSMTRPHDLGTIPEGSYSVQP
eukprot:2494488-Amphidinium_carterae.1